MSISYPLSLPTNKGFTNVVITPRSVVGAVISGFTGEQQVQPHPGQLFGMDVEMPPMQRADAEEWITFLLSLNGREGTFLAGDPNAATARGVATGTPQVNGASQTGRVLVTDGWTISTTGILLAGDMIQIGARLHKNLKDVNSDGGGNATLDIWPALRESPADNASIITANTVGVFRLASSEMPYSIGEAQFYGISFSAIEAL